MFVSMIVDLPFSVGSEEDGVVICFQPLLPDDAVLASFEKPFARSADDVVVKCTKENESVKPTSNRIARMNKVCIVTTLSWGE